MARPRAGRRESSQFAASVAALQTQEAAAVASSPAPASRADRRESSQFAASVAALQAQEAEVAHAQAAERKRHSDLTNTRAGHRDVVISSDAARWLGFLHFFDDEDISAGVLTITIPNIITSKTFDHIVAFLQNDSYSLTSISKIELANFADAVGFLQVNGLDRDGEYQSSKDLAAHIAVQVGLHNLSSIKEEKRLLPTVSDVTHRPHLSNVPNELLECVRHALKLQPEQIPGEKRAKIIQGLGWYGLQVLCQLSPLLTSLVTEVTRVGLQVDRSAEELEAAVECLAKCIEAPSEMLDPSAAQEICTQLGKTLDASIVVRWLDVRLSGASDLSADHEIDINRAVDTTRQMVAMYVRTYSSYEYLAALRVILKYTPEKTSREGRNRPHFVHEPALTQRERTEVKLRSAIRRSMAQELAHLKHGAYSTGDILPCAPNLL